MTNFNYFPTTNIRYVVTTNILIVDFKLGKKPAPDSDNHESYMQQLKVYRRGADLLYPNRQIESRIIYLADGQVSAG